MRRRWRSEIGRVRRWRTKEGERGGEGRKKMKNRKAEEEKNVWYSQDVGEKEGSCQHVSPFFETSLKAEPACNSC